MQRRRRRAIKLFSLAKDENSGNHNCFVLETPCPWKESVLQFCKFSGNFSLKLTAFCALPKRDSYRSTHRRARTCVHPLQRMYTLRRNESRPCMGLLSLVITPPSFASARLFSFFLNPPRMVVLQGRHFQPLPLGVRVLGGWEVTHQSFQWSEGSLGIDGSPSVLR